jgi:hypothetical protein
MSEKQERRTGGDLQRQGFVAGLAGVLIFLFGVSVSPWLLLLGAVVALVGLVMWGAGLVRGDG